MGGKFSNKVLHGRVKSPLLPACGEYKTCFPEVCHGRVKSTPGLESLHEEMKLAYDFPMVFRSFPHDFSTCFRIVTNVFPMVSYESLWFPMIFRWFSYDFLMLFLWCSYCFPIIFLWFSEDFLWLSHDWQRFSDWFAHGFPVIFLMVFRRCVMHFYESPMFVVRFSDASLRIFQRLS